MNALDLIKGYAYKVLAGRFIDERNLKVYENGYLDANLVHEPCFKFYHIDSGTHVSFPFDELRFLKQIEE